MSIWLEFRMMSTVKTFAEGRNMFPCMKSHLSLALKFCFICTKPVIKYVEGLHWGNGRGRVVFCPGNQGTNGSVTSSVTLQQMLARYWARTPSILYDYHSYRTNYIILHVQHIDRNGLCLIVLSYLSFETGMCCNYYRTVPMGQLIRYIYAKKLPNAPVFRIFTVIRSILLKLWTWLYRWLIWLMAVILSYVHIWPNPQMYSCDLYRAKPMCTDIKIAVHCQTSFVVPPA